MASFKRAWFCLADMSTQVRRPKVNNELVPQPTPYRSTCTAFFLHSAAHTSSSAFFFILLCPVEVSAQFFFIFCTFHLPVPSGLVTGINYEFAF